MLTAYDLGLNVDGVAVTPSYISITPEFTGGDISSGATVTGNIVYEINSGASNLKLQRKLTVIDVESSKTKDLVFTLGL